ncbi:uncharacterized protein LOC127131336 [Lathyrus oleraceus]|uniref:uncharacterized protein LOC127131336 n=1 Tax=Pisum sativum TaxID=3888 RepID=UPI0021D07425|nr:uncharacterized protein LOC127131336 [Pisum sativum]
MVSEQNHPNACGNDEFQHLGKFQRNNLPTFNGKYDPDGAQTWVRKIERIFRVMGCSEAKKVWFGTHMLVEEANDWWINTRHVLDVAVEVVTWVVFCKEFMRNEGTAELSKCIKFENGLHPETKKTIGYQQIMRFPELVNNCGNYEDDSKAWSAHYKGLSERREK